MKRCCMDAFAVIGKEGSTADGNGFIAKLWEQANASFAEIESIAEKDSVGKLRGIWGAMSDFSRSFKPWENGFTKGLYLAGVQCDVKQLPPEGWTKWIIPAFEYIVIENDSPDLFVKMIEYMKENQIPLAGAVHDYCCPKTGKNYLYFPVRKLGGE